MTRIVPLIWDRGSRGFRSRPSIELDRVPSVGELIVLPDDPSEQVPPPLLPGEEHEVVFVRHTPGSHGGVEADVHLAAVSYHHAMRCLRAGLAAQDGDGFQ